MPEIRKGEQFKGHSPLNPIPGKTKPPARYTEATLLSAMEHPGKTIENKALREAMDNTSGLGNPGHPGGDY